MNEIIKYLNNMNENGWINYSDYSNLVDMAQELDAENAQLKARLDNAVILPVPLGENFAIRDYGFGRLRVEKVRIVGYNFSPYDKSYITPVDDYGIWYYPERIFQDKAKAEAKLKELQGGGENENR